MNIHKNNNNNNKNAATKRERKKIHHRREEVSFHNGKRVVFRCAISQAMNISFAFTLNFYTQRFQLLEAEVSVTKAAPPPAKKNLSNDLNMYSNRATGTPGFLICWRF